MSLTPTDYIRMHGIGLRFDGQFPSIDAPRPGWKPTYKEAIESATCWKDTARDLEAQRDQWIEKAKAYRTARVKWLAIGWVIGAMLTLMWTIERGWR